MSRSCHTILSDGPSGYPEDPDHGKIQYFRHSENLGPKLDISHCKHWELCWALTCSSIAGPAESQRIIHGVHFQHVISGATIFQVKKRSPSFFLLCFLRCDPAAPTSSCQTRPCSMTLRRQIIPGYTLLHQNSLLFCDPATPDIIPAYTKLYPPSTTTSAPVIYEHASDAKNTYAPFNSSTVPSLLFTISTHPQTLSLPNEA
jgi:hypothetical protein